MFAALLMCAVADADAISASDRFRFPFDAHTACINWRLADAHTTWARQHADWAWADDADWRRAAWDALDNVLRTHRNDERMQRVELARLRRLIGHEAYWRGLMPFPVPWYRFRER